MLRTAYHYLSIFVTDQTAFLVLIAAAAFLKLLLCALVPASYSLRSIAASVGTSGQLSPWVALYNQIYQFWHSITLSDATVANWGSAPPLAMSTDLRLLSLLFRLPSFMFDAAIATMIYLLIVQRASTREARLGSLLWFLNPYTIFAVEMLGVPDVATSLVTVLVVMFLYRGRTFLASLFIAVGILIELYPILLLPPILIYCRRRLRVRGRHEAVLIVPPLLSLVAYLAWYRVLAPIDALLQFVAGSRVSPAAVALVVLYFAIWRLDKTDQITNSILPVFLVYYTFSNPDPQYYVWALPFLTLDIILVRRQHITVLTALLAFVFASWFVSSSGFLTPSGYSLLLIPLKGNVLPWYSQAILSFLQSAGTNALLVPLLSAGLAAMTFIYALEVIRCWFRAETKGSQLPR